MHYSLFILVLLVTLNSGAQIFIPHAHWGCKDGYDYKIINTNADFNLGTFSNTNTSGDSVQLSVGQTTGTYTSPVLDVFGGCAPLQTWEKLEWKTPLPYGKELPASSEIATDYSGISASLMNGVQELFRLNGSGAVASGTTITASIGSNGTVSNTNGAGMSYTASGKLNSALTFDGTDDRIDIPYTQTNVSDYSISTWFKTSTVSNAVFVQNRGSGAGKSLTLGIGTNPGGCTGAGKISYGVDSNTIYYGQCSNSSYNNNAWHHVVGVWDGTSGTTVATNQFTLYIDGASVSSTAMTAGTAPTAPLTGLGNTKIARHDPWAVNYAGTLDEVTIWNRPLSATEVQQIYRRGANNIKFQIKSCDNSNCSDVATWKGPDNTNATFFTEINNNSIQSTGLGSVLTANPIMTFANFPSLTVNTKRYFQYQATITTDTTTFQPDFSFVKVSHGCASGTQNYTVSGTYTFTLPKLCTSMTVTVNGGAGATGDKNGGGTRSIGGTGGQAIKTFTGLTPLTTYTIKVGSGGICSQTAGTGAYDGGAGGAVNADGNPGAGSAWGGTGGTGGTNGKTGGLGNYGGGGGGGAGSGGAVAAGGGAASSISYSGTDWIVAGGGGGSGGVQNGTAGAGGSACSGAVSGDYTFGSNGANASGTRAGGGGGGGGCYCLGGCTSASAAGGAPGNTTGNSCQASNDGGSGSVNIQYQ